MAPALCFILESIARLLGCWPNMQGFPLGGNCTPMAVILQLPLISKAQRRNYEGLQVTAGLLTPVRHDEEEQATAMLVLEHEHLAEQVCVFVISWGIKTTMEPRTKRYC